MIYGRIPATIVEWSAGTVATGDLYNFFYITLVRPALDLQGFLTFMLPANAEGAHADMKYS